MEFWMSTQYMNSYIFVRHMKADDITGTAAESYPTFNLQVLGCIKCLDLFFSFSFICRDLFWDKELFCGCHLMIPRCYHFTPHESIKSTFCMRVRVHTLHEIINDRMTQKIDIQTLVHKVIDLTIQMLISTLGVS